MMDIKEYNGHVFQYNIFIAIKIIYKHCFLITE